MGAVISLFDLPSPFLSLYLPSGPATTLLTFAFRDDWAKNCSLTLVYQQGVVW